MCIYIYNILCAILVNELITYYHIYFSSIKIITSKCDKLERVHWAKVMKVLPAVLSILYLIYNVYFFPYKKNVFWIQRSIMFIQPKIFVLIGLFFNEFQILFLLFIFINID